MRVQYYSSPTASVITEGGSPHNRVCHVSARNLVLELFLGTGYDFLRLLCMELTLYYPIWLSDVSHFCVIPWDQIGPVRSQAAGVSLMVQGRARLFTSFYSNEMVNINNYAWYNEECSGGGMGVQWNRFDFVFLSPGQQHLFLFFLEQHMLHFHGAASTLHVQPPRVPRPIIEHFCLCPETNDVNFLNVRFRWQRDCRRLNRHFLTVGTRPISCRIIRVLQEFASEAVCFIGTNNRTFTVDGLRPFVLRDISPGRQQFFGTASNIVDDSETLCRAPFRGYRAHVSNPIFQQATNSPDCRRTY